MKTKSLVSTLAASLLIGISALYAEPGDYGVNGPGAWNQPFEKRIRHTDDFGDTYYTLKYREPKACVTKAVAAHQQKVKTAPKEVLAGLNATFDAITALRENRTGSAKSSLEDAIKMFDAAFKADPSLVLVPVNVDIMVNETDDSPEMIKATLKTAAERLEEHRTQEAGALLQVLKDEMVITTYYLPMDRYPEEAKQSLAALNKGDRSAALQTLLAGVGEMVIEENVIPIPLLVAQDLVAEAAKVDRTEQAKAEAILKDADSELQKALLLGYTQSHEAEYRNLAAQIRHIQKEINGKNAVETLYGKLKEDFSALLKKIGREQHGS